MNIMHIVSKYVCNACVHKYCYWSLTLCFLLFLYKHFVIKQTALKPNCVCSVYSFKYLHGSYIIIDSYRVTIFWDIVLTCILKKLLYVKILTFMWILLVVVKNGNENRVVFVCFYQTGIAFGISGNWCKNWCLPFLSSINKYIVYKNVDVVRHCSLTKDKYVFIYVCRFNIVLQSLVFK